MTVKLSGLLYSILIVQCTVYSVQLNSSDSNYSEIECHVESFTVQYIEFTDNVQCATELY